MSDSENPPKHEGGCMCGRTRFTIFAGSNFASYCHCDDCRTSTGGALSAFVGFPTASIVWQGEPLAIYKSSKNVSRSFCPECGSPVCYDDEKLPENSYFYVGMLDNPDDFPMQSHSYIGGRLSWVHINDDLPQFDGTAAPREE